MQEIVPDIFTWAWFSEPHGYNFNGHLVRHRKATSASIRYRRTRRDLAEIVRMGVSRFSSPIVTIRGRPTSCARAPARRP